MPETLHVIEVASAEAENLVADADALASALGVESIQRDLVQHIPPGTLTGVGLAGYLTEGEGADAQAVEPDRETLDAIENDVLVLRPGALPDGSAPSPQPPLRLVGSYPMVEARGAGDTLRSTSAEGLITGAPPVARDPGADRKASGTVAMIALAVLFLIVLIVVLVAI